MKWELYGESARRGEGMAGEGTAGRGGGVTLGPAPVPGGSRKKRRWERRGRTGWGLHRPSLFSRTEEPQIPAQLLSHTFICSNETDPAGCPGKQDTPQGTQGIQGIPGNPAPLHP